MGRALFGRHHCSAAFGPDSHPGRCEPSASPTWCQAIPTEEELPPPEHLAGLIAKWAEAWQRPYVVIDTHPGTGRAGRGALGVADLVVVPTLLRTKELTALAGAVVEYHDFPC